VVVATEIRRLADQTAVASYDIEQLVKEMQSAVSAGVMGMDKFSEEVRRGVQEVEQVSEQLAQIISQVQALTPQFETVNEGMQSRSTGAQQISEALAQLTESAQQTVQSLHQSSIVMDQLNSTANDLRTSVSRLGVNGARPANPHFFLHAFYRIPDWSGPLRIGCQRYHRGPSTNEPEKSTRRAG
jgi:methyl-accepting chemotaxis protein WspA